MTVTSKQESVQVRPSRCPTHGLVEGTRNVPKLRFPFIITGVIRLAATTHPFRCPQCGATATRA
jgi:hypothetical protein